MLSNSEYFGFTYRSGGVNVLAASADLKPKLKIMLYSARLCKQSYKKNIY